MHSLISVVVPLYNKAGTVRRAVDSVLAQSYSNFELIVVDDGSTDGSADVLGAYTDPRLRVIRQPNSGVSAARNTGIRASTAEFVAFLDADDEWDSDFLSTLTSLADRYPACGAFAAGYRMCSAGSCRMPRIYGLPFAADDGILDNYFEVAAKSDPPICSISVMIRRDVLEAVGLFPDGITAGEDLLTWARIAVACPLAYTRRVVASYHTDANGLDVVPKYVPQIPDRVGEGLASLLRQSQAPGLKKYIGHWHRMRAAVYMRLGLRRKAFGEVGEAWRCHPANLKTYIYALATALPRRMLPS